ncbi:EI24 domain-containing protein [Kitasatospora purpeofusca]|uniref:EI24 domain-containing protein n=1 Tax=Kitasatospora purpeofusca TaxID=67352 RepID=UPI00224ED13A|nr:EI24 domain-containing protein [Kitasatospora purpeofusca]MCX4758581.1 EI24 domain-containing protein [Kitasatospora purpeofusca]WSR30977.1 EI24 domain-containing protein [Kitasatospora purpeofusca]WSR39010.1 EI24 domain-containing protein [Kitasatospora purpeofusca]
MRDLAAGLGYLAKGQRWVARHGRWWAFGMIPALITLAGYVVALFLLGGWAGDIAAWATPFADHWTSFWQDLLRTTLAALVFVGGLLLSVLTFTAVTLLVGQPFYEELCEKVDETEGGAPTPPDVPLWRELVVAARDSLFVLVRAGGFGVLLFAAGFVPVVGQTVVPVLGFLVSGFFLTLELTSVALQRRGVPQRERLRLLRGRLGLAFGFGVPLVLGFLVPLVTVVAMPGAVAGATLLARDLVPVEEEPGTDEEPEEGESPDRAAVPDVPDVPEYRAQQPAAANPYADNPYAGNPYPDNPYAKDSYSGAPQSAEPNPYRSA